MPRPTRQSTPNATRKRLRNDHSMMRWIIGSFHLGTAIDHLTAEERIAERPIGLHPHRTLRRARIGLVRHWAPKELQTGKRGLTPRRARQLDHNCGEGLEQTTSVFEIFGGLKLCGGGYA